MVKNKGFLSTNNILTHHLKKKKKKTQIVVETPDLLPHFPLKSAPPQPSRTPLAPSRPDHAAIDRVETRHHSQANPNSSDMGLDASNTTHVGKRHQCPCRTTPPRSETATV
jgi:hypothetical protein